MFTRTRYQYGSLETKERKKGKEVSEFRYYEPDALANASVGLSWLGHGRSIRPNPPQESLLSYRRFYCGSMQSNRVRLVLPILEQ